MTLRGEGVLENDSRQWLPAMTLRRESVREVYDRLGRRLDILSFYEAPAIEALLENGKFEDARSVFELGCGTGRFAERLLKYKLLEKAGYEAYDLSPTMVRLARERLSRFGDRVKVHLTDGCLRLQLPSANVDRFVCNYVLDLLPVEDIELVVGEAHRILADGGQLCLISLTSGSTWGSRIMASTWQRLYSIVPKLVGGCRPVDLSRINRNEDWDIVFNQVIVSFGVPSQVVVARKFVAPDSWGNR
jgi:ubiquinone/menaquinone biosynthesis C-methylase UbiE